MSRKLVVLWTSPKKGDASTIEADLDIIEDMLKDVISKHPTTQEILPVETFELRMDKLREFNYSPVDIEKLLLGGLKL